MSEETFSKETPAAKETPVAPGRRRRLAGRLAPLALLAIAAGLILGFDLDRYLTFDALRENRAWLTGFVAENMVAAALAFMALYALATALSLPGGAILSIAGGFLFGALLGTAWIVIGATLGAVAVFLIARTALGETLRAKAGPALGKMAAGFQDNALSYLLVLRLVPLFPFFLVNLVPAFLGVRPGTYLVGTFFGIIPGAFVFAAAGAGLGSVFDRAEAFSPASVLTPEVIAALAGLSLLALVPVAYKKLKARRA